VEQWHIHASSRERRYWTQLTVGLARLIGKKYASYLRMDDPSQNFNPSPQIEYTYVFSFLKGTEVMIMLF
jgi:hypothetical protein